MSLFPLLLACCKPVKKRQNTCKTVIFKYKVFDMRTTYTQYEAQFGCFCHRDKDAPDCEPSVAGYRWAHTFALH